MSAPKYYWMRVHKDFFDRHTIKILESMDKGTEISYLYLKLLTESIPFEGRLRYNKNIPYNIKMLATITNSSEELISLTIKTLQEMDLLNIQEDGTYFLVETQKMLGETNSTERVRRHRAKKKLQQNETLHETVEKPSKQKEIDTDEVENIENETFDETRVRVRDRVRDRVTINNSGKNEENEKLDLIDKLVSEVEEMQK